MPLPKRYLCCDLRIGVLGFGLTQIVLNVACASAIIFIFCVEDFKKWSNPMMCGLIANFVVVFATLVLNTFFLVQGVLLEKLGMLYVYYVLMWIDVLFLVVGSIGPAIAQPIAIPFVLAILAVHVYNILCVKSLYNKWKLEAAEETQPLHKPE